MTEFKNAKQKLGAKLWEADGIDSLTSILTNERNQDSVTPTRSHSKSTGLLTNILPHSIAFPHPSGFCQPLDGIRRLTEVSGGGMAVSRLKLPRIKTDIRAHILEITWSHMSPFSSCLSSIWHKPALHFRVRLFSAISQRSSFCSYF